MPRLLGASDLNLQPIAFDAISRAEWDRLLLATPSATPFSRWTFHRAWWDAYGDTAHEQYLRVAGENDQTLAIVPLMHRHAIAADDVVDRTMLRDDSIHVTPLPDDVKAVFFGASYHADYATILADPADLTAVTRRLADALESDPAAAGGSERWDLVDLRRLRATDPALPLLDAAFRGATDAAAWTVIREVEDVCPVVSVEAGTDWDGYLATLDKKDRHEIRRKLRRAAAVGELSVEIAPPNPFAIEEFIRLHRARWGERGLFPDTPGGERSRRFVQRLAELELAEADGGQLHVALVRCGERTVFSALAFDDGMTSFMYNAGMDPSASETSPGVTGTALYIQDRLVAGRLRFDFLRGNEAYKYEWGAQDESIERVLVIRKALA